MPRRKRERGVSTRVARTANHPASSPVVDSFRLPLTRANPARLNLVYARAVSSASYWGGTVLINSCGSKTMICIAAPSHNKARQASRSQPESKDKTDEKGFVWPEEATWQQNSHQ